MNKESGRFSNRGEGFQSNRVEGITGQIITIDSSGEATMHKFKTSKEIKAMKRKATLKTKTGDALSALKPLLVELATHGVEATDTGGYDVELVDGVDRKNPFVIDGHIQETFKRSIKSLLQGKGQNFSWIAEQLLTSSKIRNAEFPDSIEEPKSNLVRLMRNINSSK